MLNIIWLSMMVIAVIVGAFTGKIPAIILSVTESAKFAFTLALGLTAVMSLWLGIMKIAEESGLIDLFTKALRPVLTRLFPDVPIDHPAMGAMSLNIAANMLGLNNAAMPFGLRAMVELEKINPHPGIATNTMCTYLALHSSNLQIIPTTAITLLAAGGALHPTDIIIPFILSSICAAIAAVIVSKTLEKLPRYRQTIQLAQNEGASS
jgi:spore maturation protein A